MIGTPALPGTRAPLPFRLLATPGLGALISRQKPTPASVRRFAATVGEGATMGHHSHRIDSMVAGGRKPGAAATGRREVRTIVSPLALLTRSGFRRDARILPQELGRLRTPTLLVWGDHDPVGSPVIAQRLAEMLPDGHLRMVPGGHVPWLGSPDAVASALTGFVSPRGLAGGMTGDDRLADLWPTAGGGGPGGQGRAKIPVQCRPKGRLAAQPQRPSHKLIAPLLGGPTWPAQPRCLAQGRPGVGSGRGNRSELVGDGPGLARIRLGDLEVPQ